ncbi:conserved hypothetical protein [Roseibium sp. TrichSKD4]|nr:conserved hypothetical protein [Roseibium sp. TrichSKD4]
MAYRRARLGGASNPVARVMQIGTLGVNAVFAKKFIKYAAVWRETARPAR